MCGCHWWRCFVFRTLQKHPDDRDRSSRLIAVCNCVSFSAVAGMLTSWLNRRRRRYLFLVLCSPFLLPLFCLACPLICALEVCCCVCQKRRKVVSGGGYGRRRCDDGGDEAGLLQRYLEDQLLLVGESVYDCGDDGGVDVEYCDSARPLLQ